MRRLARANAENRRVLQKGFGRTVGGKRIPPGADIRKVLADAADRRATIDRGCASGTAQAGRLAEQTERHTFRTKAEEDDANNRAIAEALFDLLEEEEAQKMRGTFSTPAPSGGLVWDAENGLAAAEPSTSGTGAPVSEEQQMKWALEESLKASTHRPLKRSLPPDDQEGLVTHREKASNHRPGTTIRKDTPLIDLTGDDEEESSLEEPATSRPLHSDSWACQVCTYINPRRYLVCDACGMECPPSKERSAPSLRAPSSDQCTASASPSKAPEDKKNLKKSLGWNCRECGTFVEHMWWCCTLCGLMKDRS